MGHHRDDLAEALAGAYARALSSGSQSLVVGYATNGSRDPSPDFSLVTNALGAHRELSTPEMKSFPWTHRYSRDAWLDELLTHSDHAALPDDVRLRLFDEIGRTIDRFGGAFDMTYRSILITSVVRS